MKILFITLHDPFDVGGASYASHAYLRAFSDIAESNIDICIADHCMFPDVRIAYSHLYKVPRRSNFHKLLSVFTGELHRYTSFVKELLRHSSDYDYCVFDTSYVAGSLVKYVNQLGIKTITIHHNYQPEYFVDNTPSVLMRYLFLHHVRNMEKTSYLRSNYNLFLTEADMQKFKMVYGVNTACNSLIGVFEFNDYEKPKLKVDTNEKKTFVITGTLNAIQGIDGIRYFFTDLYDSLPSNCKIIISGRNPTKEIKSLCSIYPNVELIENPKDMNEIISKGDVYICPTRLGGGLKLRIMDGLKLGLPVIAHSCSARGYDMFFDTPYFQIFSNIKEFNLGMEKLWNVTTNKSKVVELYSENFSYQAGLKRLRNILNK